MKESFGPVWLSSSNKAVREPVTDGLQRRPAKATNINAGTKVAIRQSHSHERKDQSLESTHNWKSPKCKIEDSLLIRCTMMSLYSTSWVIKQPLCLFFCLSLSLYISFCSLSLSVALPCLCSFFHDFMLALFDSSLLLYGDGLVEVPRLVSF